MEILTRCEEPGREKTKCSGLNYSWSWFTNTWDIPSWTFQRTKTEREREEEKGSRAWIIVVRVEPGRYTHGSVEVNLANVSCTKLHSSSSVNLHFYLYIPLSSGYVLRDSDRAWGQMYRSSLHLPELWSIIAVASSPLDSMHSGYPWLLVAHTSCGRWKSFFAIHIVTVLMEMQWHRAVWSQLSGGFYISASGTRSFASAMNR